VEVPVVADPGRLAGYAVRQRAEPTGQQARRAKEVIGRQVGHLTRLVDDLLEVNRITRRKVELRRVRLDLGELVRRTGEDHRDLLRQRGLDFAVNTPDLAVWVDGDETRLAQVIGNLIRNAAKFTPTGGQVTLLVVAVDGKAEFHVIDTGTGMALGHGGESTPRLP
jgi:two-component system CheB/CheR fusion protein